MRGRRSPLWRFTLEIAAVLKSVLGILLMTLGVYILFRGLWFGALLPAPLMFFIAGVWLMLGSPDSREHRSYWLQALGFVVLLAGLFWAATMRTVIADDNLTWATSLVFIVAACCLFAVGHWNNGRPKR